MKDQPSVELTRRSRDGDDAALSELLRRHQPWVEGFVRRRLGPLLRRHAETLDYVQEALVRAIRYGPELLELDDKRFRALLGRIVENQLRDAFEYAIAERRDGRREVGFGSRSDVGGEDLRRASVGTPSRDAARNEEQRLVELAIELLPPSGRIAILLRREFDIPFAELGRVLGTSEEGARKRHDRAVTALAGVVGELQTGRAAEAVDRAAAAALREDVERALRRWVRDRPDQDAARDAARRVAAVVYAVDWCDDEDTWLREVERALERLDTSPEAISEVAALVQSVVRSHRMPNRSGP